MAEELSRKEAYKLLKNPRVKGSNREARCEERLLNEPSKIAFANIRKIDGRGSRKRSWIGPPSPASPASPGRFQRDAGLNSNRAKSRR
jgi:hypothetical protein